MNHLLFVISTIRLFVVLIYNNYKYDNYIYNNYKYETTIPDSCECKSSKFTRDLKILTYSRILSTICKGPNYRFPSPADPTNCRKEIAGSLQELHN